MNTANICTGRYREKRVREPFRKEKKIKIKYYSFVSMRSLLLIFPSSARNCNSKNAVCGLPHYALSFSLTSFCAWLNIFHVQFSFRIFLALFSKSIEMSSKPKSSLVKQKKNSHRQKIYAHIKLYSSICLHIHVTYLHWLQLNRCEFHNLWPNRNDGRMLWRKSAFVLTMAKKNIKKKNERRKKNKNNIRPTALP